MLCHMDQVSRWNSMKFHQPWVQTAFLFEKKTKHKMTSFTVLISWYSVYKHVKMFHVSLQKSELQNVSKRSPGLPVPPTPLPPPVAPPPPAVGPPRPRASHPAPPRPAAVAPAPYLPPRPVLQPLPVQLDKLEHKKNEAGRSGTYINWGVGKL